MLSFDEIREYCESFTNCRYTKKELEENLSNKFGKKIQLADTTDLDEKGLDYMLTCNIIGDNDECEDFVDTDFYYLPMRDNKTLYITEVYVAKY